ncbi:MAG: Threonine-tRNA ligase [Candidatus Roizmanbacteria bacterium GW2011_GWC2_37_13]|uniref:Threonine--tRNA ligase n=1 Tax=Candidatus Roizmanbacteria bacterium GW2011_GWC2_37_13 TaxID=1618486 RepID=A0A0G0G3L2_9BACT|nr:MAG: Threonine-tRNA ligase [Candidatus Roizmanbacteria bacterium GW2011_GWC1_37_12]KKQ25718.1 MAG: Threonine-tRNA ligase [Candidatus Roizmanbacteria bacterium GW2011_GWC2_37_13]
MDNKNLDSLRHSCAHLLAHAVKQLYPGALNAIGPAIENGFYQDFDMGKWSISEEDFQKIEAKMREILPRWQKFTFKEVTLVEAKKLFKDNKYKVEMAKEFAKQGKKLQTNDPGDFLDLCKMGHVENPSKELRNFKLLSVAGAYWRGSEKNKMLTRIYGTVWPSEKELKEHLIRLEEAKKRDHRKLGQDLDLFVFSDLVGKGLPLLTPKGATIKRILERFIVDEELKRGYSHVSTPPIAKVDLYRTSGHYPYYKETMYPPMVVDDEELILRPMTCPHHFALFKSRPRSYHEMPVSFAEISPQFRYEKSGELTGLIRVRTFLLSDAHIITPKEKAEEEIKKVLDLISFINKAFGLKAGKDYRFRLSLGDRKDSKKYYKDDKMWDYAESILRKVLKNQEVPYYEAENEAAFYGPKIDVQMKNVNGKEDTAFTVQYDFVMPKRFELRFINHEGKEEEPVVIHRASIGAFERTMAFLIEHYAGAFPLWLAPVQIAILPVSDKFKDYILKVEKTLKEAGLRIEVNQDNETLGKKIRKATLQKIPYMIIIGEKEVETEQCSVRTRDGKDLGQLTINQFISNLKSQIEKFL